VLLSSFVYLNLLEFKMTQKEKNQLISQKSIIVQTSKSKYAQQYGLYLHVGIRAGINSEKSLNLAEIESWVTLALGLRG
jgi:hypothetical protein